VPKKVPVQLESRPIVWEEQTTLQQQARFFHRFLESTSEAVVFLDPKMRVLEINSNARKLLDPEPNAIGKHCWEVFTGENEVCEFCPILASVKQRRKTEVEVRMVSADSHKKVWLRIKSQPVYSEKRRYLGTAVVMSDITDHRRLQATIDQKEEQYRNLFENSLFGVYRSTPDGHLEIINPALTRKLGIPENYSVERINVGEIGYAEPETRKRFIEAIERNGYVTDFEAIWKTLDGTTIIMRESARAVRDGNGKTLYYEGVVEDITARRRAEAELQSYWANLEAIIQERTNELEESNVQLLREIAERQQIEEELRHARASLQQIIDAQPNPIFIKDSHHHWTLLNDSAVAFLGHSREEMLGKSDYDFFPKEEADVFWTHDDEVLQGETTSHEEFLTDAEGTRRFILTKKAPLVQSDGSVNLLGVITDLTAWKKAQEALLESQELYRDLVEKGEIAILIKDCNMKPLYYNQRFVEMSGYTKEDVFDLDLRDVIHPDDFERVKEIHDHRIHGEPAPDHYEMRAIRKDGSVMYVEIDAQLLVDEGKVSGTRSYIWDITERKQIEESLRQSELRNKAIVAAFPDLLLRLRADGTILDFKAPTEDSFLDQNRIVINRSMTEQRLPADLIRLGMQATQKVIDTGQPETIEYQIPIANQLRQFEARVVTCGPDEVLFIARDITDRKEFEEKLRLSDEILQRAGALVILANSDGTVRYVSPSVRSILGYDPDELIGDNWWVVSGANTEERRREKHNVSAAARGERPINPMPYERMIAHRNGESRWVLFQDAPGPYGTLIGIGQDITGRKIAEKALQKAKEAAEQANRLKSEFIFNVSHEIRTPLNIIIGSAEIILHYNDIGRIHEKTQFILHESEILLQLINDLLDHAKIEAGKMVFEYHPLNLASQLSSIRDTFADKANEKRVDLRLEIGDGLPANIVADELRLRQVLVNLMSNAVKFTDKGFIVLRCDLVEILPARSGSVQRRARLRYCVEDTGIGIPKEKQELIFHSFTQADGSTTRKYGGTGLGTTIAQSLVRLMGGQLQLESEVNRGSSFFFTVDFEIAEEEADALSTEEEEEDAREYHGTILFAEDYAPNQEIVRTLLEEAGFTVEIVDNGEKAISAAQEKTYDLILMDIQMPVLDGIQATQQIRMRGINRSVPIIALTAHADALTRRQCIEAGMNDMITKPARRDMLLKTLDLWIPDDQEETQSDRPFEWQNNIAEEFTGAKPSISDTLNYFPIDYESALRDFGGNRELLGTVLNQYLVNLERRLPYLRTAIDQADSPSLQRDLCILRAGAVNLNALPLANLTERMLQESSPCQAESIRFLLAEMEREYKRLYEYIQDMNKPVSSGEC
jgi:PAS domain S-box-containing protein